VLTLGLPAGPLRVVTLGAHPDDVELGCGATLLRLLAEHPGSAVRGCVLTGSPERAAEARRAAELFTGPGATLTQPALPDGRLPAHFAAVKDAVHPLAAEPADLVLAPWPGDAHQDHRLLGEVAGQAFREHLVLHYEIAKYDGDLGRPGVYVGLDRALVTRKAALLHAAFPSQHGRDWWGEETVLALARVRGVEARSAGGYAEAFHCARVLL